MSLLQAFGNSKKLIHKKLFSVRKNTYKQLCVSTSTA